MERGLERLSPRAETTSRSSPTSYRGRRHWPAQDHEEERVRGSYNAIVDQELREIWEVRYWGHLLEGPVSWEDRE